MSGVNRDVSAVINDYLSVDDLGFPLYSVRELMKKHSIDSKNLYCLLKRKNIQTRNKSVTFLVKIGVIDDYNSGETLSNIRQKYSINNTQIYKIVYGSGNTLRNKTSKESIRIESFKIRKLKATPYRDLVFQIHSIVNDYNLENEGQRVFSVNQLLDKYNCTQHTFYSVLRKALELKITVFLRRGFRGGWDA